MIALLDGDVLVYGCGFSSDGNARKEAVEVARLAGRPHTSDEDLAEMKEPLDFALKIVKNKIEEVMETTKATECKIYIGGKGNYRFDIQPDYKANRKGAKKPHWYKEIREYLLGKHEAIITDGQEADDALGIEQMTNEDDITCICTIDKDLDCVPGFHYNWSPKRYMNGVYEVSEVEANRFFYTQCLTGDATDNIPGLKKTTGAIATKKKKDPILSMERPLDMYNHVNALYAGFDWHPIAQCLWIRQAPDEIWQPPTEKENTNAEKDSSTV